MKPLDVLAHLSRMRNAEDDPVRAGVLEHAMVLIYRGTQVESERRDLRELVARLAREEAALAWEAKAMLVQYPDPAPQPPAVRTEVNAEEVTS